MRVVPTGISKDEKGESVLDGYAVLYDTVDGPTLAAHCVHINDEERELLAQKGVWMAHGPASNLKLGSGVFDLAAMRSIPNPVIAAPKDEKELKDLLYKGLEIKVLRFKQYRSDYGRYYAEYWYMISIEGY